jgi:hypothetical protein
MTTVRTDFFKLGDKFATVLGDDVKAGLQAPEFTAVALDWSPVNPVAQSKGKVAILSAVPSLDTDVCDRETRRFNEEAANLSDDILIWTISTDLPTHKSDGAARPGSIKCALFLMCLKRRWALSMACWSRSVVPCAVRSLSLTAKAH